MAQQLEVGTSRIDKTVYTDELITVTNGAKMIRKDVSIPTDVDIVLRNKIDYDRRATSSRRKIRAKPGKNNRPDKKTTLPL